MRILFILSVFFVFSYAGVWSSNTKSGIYPSYDRLDSFIQSQNQMLENIYANEVKALIDEIEKLTKENNKLLNQIKDLNKEIAKTDEELTFLLDQELKLLSISSDVNANKE
ncbi:hypothetical protein [Campylobacter hyointestinalis]|uniref:hypothetical protein n=1 Tax=Campylobacter hyointestinalis TaxID=198 RepID=UPI0011ADC7E6|nr:hypothetical protein [Campylobacter hyointestinalis]TWO30704.1 hypothetical protein YZ79_01990 [Campylobacter hyointestinalis]